MDLKEFNNELKEFNQPTNDYNPTDQIVNKKQRYNASTGTRTAMQSKTQRITRKDLVDLTKTKDMGVLLSQLDASFKLVLMAADGTPVEQFVISQLNQVKQRIAAKIEQVKKQSGQI